MLSLRCILVRLHWTRETQQVLADLASGTA
jgi:hypothetical protein